MDEHAAGRSDLIAELMREAGFGAFAWTGFLEMLAERIARREEAR